jgi:hypothetical protein
MFPRLQSAVGALALVTLTGTSFAARPQLAPQAAWPPAVREAYAAVLATPAGAPGKAAEVAKKMLALVMTGAAHDALGSLAFDDKLPESHRAISGIWFVKFYTFDPAALLGLTEDANPFVQREAITQLADLGGKEISAKLAALAAKNPRLAGAVRAAMPRVSPVGKPPFVLAQLNTLLRGKVSKQKSMAAAVLSQSKEEAAEWGLTKLLSPQMSTLADKTTQIDGALSLTRRHAKDVPGLVKLTARGNNKFVRYEALKLLAKSPAGKKELRGLTFAPGDPMAKERDALVR